MADAPTLLHTLPEGHRGRNIALAELGAQCRNWKGKDWREVRTWGIGASTYNQLSNGWHTFNEFRAVLPVEG